MYKVRSKVADEEEVITKEFATRAEAIEYMFDCCNAKDMNELRKAQQEYNIRFYCSC